MTQHFGHISGLNKKILRLNLKANANSASMLLPVFHLNVTRTL